MFFVLFIHSVFPLPLAASHHLAPISPSLLLASPRASFAQLVEYLSTTKEAMEWASCSLPNGRLFLENAILLSRYNRYPLVVDPSEVELGGAPTRERGGAGGDHKHRVSTAERVDLFFRSPLGEEEEAPDPAALEGAGGDDDVMWRDDEVPRAMNRDAGARTHARIVVASV